MGRSTLEQKKQNKTNCPPHPFVVETGDSLISLSNDQQGHSAHRSLAMIVDVRQPNSHLINSVSTRWHSFTKSRCSKSIR